ncbi:MAG: ABC-F family ATP-binding cassette domain-containing protein [Patescibacteria group bacterium]|jgi:ATP-binding cassette subfamily F protein 3
MRTLLVASGLNKTYGRQTVLDGLSLNIPDRARIGLIGRNGSGKTTLFRLLAGAEKPDSGEVALMAGTHLGVLNQNEVLPADGDALGFLADASGKPTWECERLAARFGLKTAELALPPAALSGGYQMRLKLVRMLLADPNLLLLDEPVNYLDLPTLLLLESFLRRFSGALVITSHDREVLQNLCTTTWEIERGKLQIFTGDVETYLDWKEEQAEYTRRTNKKLRREIAANQAFADRFRFKASQASRAQSKLKHIAKLRTQLRDLDPKLATAAFRIPCPAVVPGTAVRCEELAVGYGHATIARNISFEIVRGTKAAIVGENGRGKSTLLKTLADVLPPLAGTYKWWHRADIGYFAQHAEEALLPQETVLQALTRAAKPETSGERILATAGAFLFREDDLEKTCGVLSGGERARVRLARLVLQEHNVLLLDEPTNHLDAETVDILARALREYPGTVVVVSHARTFMNALAERVYEVRNGTLRPYLGTYEDYVADLASQAEAEDTALMNDPVAAPDAAARRERAAQERDRRRSRQKLEEKMKVLEKEKGEILKFFFENPTDYSPEKSRRLAELEEQLGQLEQEWFRLAE